MMTLCHWFYSLIALLPNDQNNRYAFIRPLCRGYGRKAMQHTIAPMSINPHAPFC